MEITKEDAEIIVRWADIAENESQYFDADLIKRINTSFPSIEIPEYLLTPLS